MHRSRGIAAQLHSLACRTFASSTAATARSRPTARVTSRTNDQPTPVEQQRVANEVFEGLFSPTPRTNKAREATVRAALDTLLAKPAPNQGPKSPKAALKASKEAERAHAQQRAEEASRFARILASVEAEQAGNKSHAALDDALVDAEELLSPVQRAARQMDAAREAAAAAALSSRTDASLLENGSSDPHPPAEDWYLDKVYHAEGAGRNPTSDVAPEQRWMKSTAATQIAPSHTRTTSGPLQLQDILADLEDERALHIAVLDLRPLPANVCEYMVVAEGRSKRHIYALADAVRRSARGRIALDAGMPRNVAIEGVETEDWMCVDLGRYVINCMTPESRRHFDLEGLWQGRLDAAIRAASVPSAAPVASL
jgi:ribosome silencing factor RsfS/YbeB/iojap